MTDCATMATKLLDTPPGECVILAAGLPPRALMKLRRLLRGMHLRVRVAGSLEDALAMLKRHAPQLVLAGGDDAALLFWRARRMAGRQVACLGLLERATPRDMLDMLTAGADECLAWPFPDYMLARRLARMQAFA